MVSVTSPPARNAPANSKMQAINSAVFKEIAPDPTDVPKAFATSFAPIPHAMMNSAGKYPSAALIDYGATKSAMISISKSLAKKYGRDGVLVNSVLPGLIHTAMWERAAGEIAESTGSSAEEVIKKNGFSVPIGRYGTSEEVAALVVFLCSNAASYINGSAIEVDGGQAGHI